MNDPVFTKHGDGSVTIDHFYPVILVSKEFLQYAHPAFLSREGFRKFRIEVANGGAVYRIQRRHEKYPNCYICRITP